MSVDVRTRRYSDVRSLDRDEILDTVLPDAVRAHGELAARGLASLDLPALALDMDGEQIVLSAETGRIVLKTTDADTGITALLTTEALSDLLQDVVSMMGLAMTSRVKITSGSVNDWVRWEPVLRSLLDGRKVHQAGDVRFVDRDGHPLDLDRSFTLDDDRGEMRHFLEEAGFLHLRGVFSEPEMDEVATDIDDWLARATPDDGQSWWATDERGTDVAVRILFFYEKSEALRRLLDDDRFRWMGDLPGDGHRFGHSAEGLIKPLGITRGLSDLPWHKDCGQGGHSYMCNGLTCGISVTGADRTSGALGVIPGSHRANTVSSGRDSHLDLEPKLLETRTGDVTIHLSDTLHRAYPPVDLPRKVVYSGFVLPPRPGDEVERDMDKARAQRAELSDVQSRIEAADNERSATRYRAGRGR